MLRNLRERAAGEGDLDGLEAEERGPREVKVHVGVHFDEFTLPDDAREHVERATDPDHPAPVVAVEEGDALDRPDANRVVGADPGVLAGDRDDDAGPGA
jgi:hypothetical protein